MLNLLPNELWDYRAADLVRGLGVALSTRQSGADAAIAIPGVGRSIPVRSARAAIVLGLRALRLRPGASVGVPLYCCPVVFKAIVAAGCAPRFLDVEPRTYCLSASDLAAKCAMLDAVVAVHMFGNVCDMDAVRNAAGGKPVIEDCAQGLGSRFGQAAAGSFGDVAAFSFRLGKYLSVGEGGAVVAKSGDLQTRLEEMVRALPAPGRPDECRHVAATYLRALLRTPPLWGPVGTRVWKAYNDTVGYTSMSPLVIARMHRTDVALTARRLPRLPEWIDRQRRNADYYSQHLAVDADMLCAESRGAFYNRLQYPVLMPSPEECDDIAARLLAHGITTGRPYKDIASVARRHYGYTGDCPEAERIASTVLVIPCNHSLSTGDVEHVRGAFNRAWEEICRTRARIAV